MNYFKAIVGSLISLGGSLGTAATDGNISMAEWIVAVTAGLVAFGGVAFASNKAAAKDA